MCRWTLLCVSLTSLVVAIPEEHQYCAVRYRRLCQGKGRHIACQFPDAGPGQSCDHYTQIKFTNELKHFVTHYLNRRRQRIASGNERVRGGVHLPKPQVMMLVEWDRELALLAQRLADQCHFVHDDCRATVRYPYAGQTVGEVRWRRSSDSDELSAQRAIRRVLDAWWGERRRVQPKQLTAPFRLTAKGTIWGHFSQLAVWNLQAVGCGAVRHGAYHPRLLLVCDFSHTNMLGQRTLVPGPISSCPIHTARRSRTSYPLLCAPVRRPIPSEPELEMEDNYEDYEEQEENDITSVEEHSTTRRLFQSNSERKANTKIKAMSTEAAEDFTEVSRKMYTKMFREYETSPATLKEPIVPKVDLEMEQEHSPQNERQNPLANHKLAHSTFDSSQFENAVRKEWRMRQKPNFGQWRQQQENHESEDNSEEVIPLTISRSDTTEAFNPRVAEIYRPIPVKGNIQRVSNEGYPSAARKEIQRVNNEGYPSAARKEVTESDEANYRPRWRQTRIRPQRPGANALLSRPGTEHSGKNFKKENVASHLSLDTEDIDQLFRDTGFDVHWRKHTT